MADDEDSVRVEERVKIKIGEFHAARRLITRSEVASNIFAPRPVKIFSAKAVRELKTQRPTQQVSFEWAWASPWALWALIWRLSRYLHPLHTVQTRDGADGVALFASNGVNLFVYTAC